MTSAVSQDGVTILLGCIALSSISTTATRSTIFLPSLLKIESQTRHHNPNRIPRQSNHIRRPYNIKHLLALRAAMSQCVRVQVHCFWTASANWEGADGYSPNFRPASQSQSNSKAVMPSALRDSENGL